MNKRLALVFMLILVTGAVAQLSAELLSYSINSDDSNMYVRTLYIEEVNMTRFGYRIVYRQGSGRLATTLLPLTWFTGAGSKGKVNFIENNDAVPFLESVFIDNEFSHVNLYLPAETHHQAYRIADPTRNWRDSFEQVETLNLSY